MRVIERRHGLLGTTGPTSRQKSVGSRRVGSFVGLRLPPISIGSRPASVTEPLELGQGEANAATDLHRRHPLLLDQLIERRSADPEKVRRPFVGVLTTPRLVHF